MLKICLLLQPICICFFVGKNVESRKSHFIFIESSFKKVCMRFCALEKSAWLRTKLLTLCSIVCLKHNSQEKITCKHLYFVKIWKVNAILLLNLFLSLEIPTANLGGKRGKYLNRHMDNVFVVLSFQLFLLISK